MEVAVCEDILRVSGITELAAPNSDSFRRQVRAALPGSTLQAVEIDLSQTQFIDSCGLGALIAVQKCATNHNGNGAVPVRLLNPTPSVQHLLELTRLHRNFEIIRNGEIQPSE